MISLYYSIIEQKLIISLVLTILSWLTYSFVLWRLFKKNAKRSFDFSIIGVLVTLILNRIFYVFFYSQNFVTSYWSVYPFSWKDGYRILFDTKPWIILAFWRGGLDIRIFLISFLVSILIINVFYKEHIIRLFNNILKAAISSYLVLLLLSYYKSEYIGRGTQQLWGIRFFDLEGRRHPIQIYAFITAILGMAIISLIQKRLILISKINGFIWGCVFFLVNAVIMYYYGEDIPKYIIMWNMLFSLINLMLIIVVLLGQYISNKGIIKVGKRAEKFVRKKMVRRKFGNFSNIV